MNKLKELYFYTRNIKNRSLDLKKKLYNNLFNIKKFKKLAIFSEKRKDLLYNFSKKNLKLLKKRKWRIRRKIYDLKKRKKYHKDNPSNKFPPSKTKSKELKQIKRYYRNLFFIAKYPNLRKTFFISKKADKKCSKKLLKRKKALGPDCKGVFTLKMSNTNVLFTLSDMKGQILGIRSVGCLGFKGKKKRMTKFALKASIAAAIRDMKRMKWTKLVLCFDGYSKVDHILFPLLLEGGLSISCMRVKTSIAHNGCRPPKPRTG